MPGYRCRHGLRHHPSTRKNEAQAYECGRSENHCRTRSLFHLSPAVLAFEQENETQLPNQISLRAVQELSTESEILEQPHIGTTCIFPEGQATAVRGGRAAHYLRVTPFEQRPSLSGQVDIYQSRARTPGTPSHVATNPDTLTVRGPVQAYNDFHLRHWNISGYIVMKTKYPKFGLFVWVLRREGYEVFSVWGKIPVVGPILFFYPGCRKLSPLASRRIEGEESVVFGVNL